MSKWQYMFGSDQVQSSTKFLYHENIFFRQNKILSSPSFKQSWALSGVYHRVRLYTTVWWTRSSPSRRSPSSSPPLPRTTWQSSVTIRAIALVILSVLQLSTYYESKTVVKALGVEKLSVRRKKICLQFAKKSQKHQKFSKWFKPSKPNLNIITRQKKSKFCPVICKKARFEKSPLNYLTQLLNQHFDKPK